MNEEKFTYKEGEILVSIPQCINCKHKDMNTCKLKGDIPDDAYKNECAEFEER